MIHLIYGKDGYLVRQALRDVRAALAAADDMLDTNTTVLDGASLSPPELLGHAQTVPFLANSRLVIVEGLLAQIGAAKRGRRSKKPAAGDPLAPWQAVAEQLADAGGLPETTTLVFVEAALDRNAAFPIFAPIARTVACDGLSSGDLPGWIKRAADARGVALAPRALTAIAQLTAGDLWQIENELDKLAAFAGSRLVDEGMVAQVVSSAQEARIWDLTDAVVAGDERTALAAMSALLDDGQAPQLLLFMLVRQYRQLALVKDLRARKARQDEIARAAGVPSFRVNTVAGLAARFGWPQIHEAYTALLDADLAVKRGLRDDEASLQLAVHQLCALARPASLTPGTYARRAGSSSG